MDFVSVFLGILVELVWILSYLEACKTETSKFYYVRIVFEVFSIINSILFIFKTKTVQLFYSDSSALSRSHHVKARTISSKRRKTLRYLIGKFLRGTAEQKEEKPWTLGTVIEIDVWVIGELSKNIFIFLNPLAVVFTHLIEDPVKAVIGIVIVNAFFFFFMMHVESSIADQKLIGEELYKTQTNQMQDRLIKSAPNDYAERVILRRLNYGKTGIPRYGPGTDLRPYYKNLYQEDSDEGNPSLANERSPVFRQK